MRTQQIKTGRYTTQIEYSGINNEFIDARLLVILSERPSDEFIQAWFNRVREQMPQVGFVRPIVRTETRNNGWAVATYELVTRNCPRNGVPIVEWQTEKFQPSIRA